MKAIVLKRYRDKHTMMLHQKGTEIEITSKRCAELNGTPFGVLVEEIKETGKKLLKSR